MGIADGEAAEPEGGRAQGDQQEEYHRLRELGASHEEASNSALEVAVMQSMTEMVGGRLLNKLPVLRDLHKYANTPGGSFLGRAGARFGGDLVAETGIEIGQPLIAALKQDISKIGGDVSWLADDGPLQTAWRNAPETVMGVMLICLMGSGVATAGDVSRSYEMAGSVPMLMQAQYSREQAEDIVSQSTPHARMTRMQELWGSREGTVQTMTEAAAENQQMVQGEWSAEEQAVKMGMIPAIGNTGNGYSMRLKDRVVVFDTYEDAREARKRLLEESGLSEEKVFGDLASQVAYFEKHEGAGREVSILRMSEDVTVDEFARLNPQATVEAFQRNGIENKLTGEDAQATERYILGTSQSEFADKVYRTAIRIAPSGTPQTVIEEVAETDAKLMLLDGMGDKLRGWMRELETPNHKLLADDSDMALVEGYSRLVTAYSLNQRKELEKMGLDPTNLRQKGGGIRGMLRNYRTLFGEVFKRSLALRKSMKDGKLTPELEMKVRESLGMREKAAVDANKVRREPVVVGTKMTFALGDSPLKKAEDFLKQNVVNRPITTFDGLTATVSNDSVGKMIKDKAAKKSASLKVHLAAIEEIVELFQAGSVVETKTNAAKSLTAIRHVHSAMLFEGKGYKVQFKVKEIQHKDNRIYSIEAMDIGPETTVEELMQSIRLESDKLQFSAVSEGEGKQVEENKASLLWSDKDGNVVSEESGQKVMNKGGRMSDNDALERFELKLTNYDSIERNYLYENPNNPKTYIDITFVNDETIFVNMIKNSENFSGVGHKMFERVIKNSKKEVKRIKGVAAMDNLDVLNGGGSIYNTPFFKSLRPLGFEKGKLGYSTEGVIMEVWK